MPFKIVRNDITKMECDAIVNTASRCPVSTFEQVGAGCDKAIHKAAGADKLIKARKEIGVMMEGEAAITPGFDLPAKYIIHAVSPAFFDGNSGEEEKLRSCYRNSLRIAKENGIKSIAFPLIATGSFGYPQEEGMRIAVDEINTFLLHNDMLIYLVVFGNRATQLGERIFPDLEAYIDHNYVDEKRAEEYGDWRFRPTRRRNVRDDEYELENLESRLDERMQHLSDTFSEYLMFLIQSKGKTPVEVYTKAIVDKKVFSKIKNNPDHHPNKLTALCLCVGAELDIDETKELLARAGFALSPCDKTDIIFKYFIEHGIYDMIELDIQLEEHGLKCIIT
jgi:O-acetyl-ADP-ribose deacetylase (regulator of RNase III)